MPTNGSSLPSAYTHTASIPATMATFGKLKNRAIVHDILYGAQRINPGHKTAINVLYANGGAKTVQMSMFNKNDIYASTDGPGGLAKNDAARRIWFEMDRQ